MNIQKGSFSSIEQLQDRYLSPAKKVEKKERAAVSFQDILKAKQETAGTRRELKFSKHASNRLTDRNSTLTNSQWERLESGAVKAGEKGIQESLVVVDELAFIVNIPNKTVITAMDTSDTADNVFTNIDGAVFM